MRIQANCSRSTLASCRAFFINLVKSSKDYIYCYDHLLTFHSLTRMDDVCYMKGWCVLQSILINLQQWAAAWTVFTRMQLVVTTYVCVLQWAFAHPGVTTVTTKMHCGEQYPLACVASLSKNLTPHKSIHFLGNFVVKVTITTYF